MNFADEQSVADGESVLDTIDESNYDESNLNIASDDCLDQSFQTTKSYSQVSLADSSYDSLFSRNVGQEYRNTFEFFVDKPIPSHIVSFSKHWIVLNLNN